MSQQTPLAQKPLPHADPLVHAPPLGRFASHSDVVVLQYAVVTQSASAAHVVLQLVAPHVNRPQLLVAGAVPHAPAPLQKAGGCSTPPTHVAVTQLVAAPA